MMNFGLILKTELELFGSFSTLGLTYLCLLDFLQGGFWQVNAANLHQQAGHPFVHVNAKVVVWIWVLMCKSFYSFQKQNPDSSPKLSYFMFVWFFRIFSL